MNKTININLGGYFFHIDETAYQKLRKYLDAIAKSLSDDPEGKNEIIADIEARICELLCEKITETRQVVNELDIHHIIKIMGEPEDYSDSDESFQKTQSKSNNSKSNSKKLFRDRENRLISGVSAGIAHYLDLDVVWIRILCRSLQPPTLPREPEQRHILRRILRTRQYHSTTTGKDQTKDTRSTALASQTMRCIM